ncbi:hypothetical protein [Streptomyces sp. NPDC053367]|uniref:hypothetical protein n=1 Tax=Streptomyces sp. NPDC053367 TaxID=3365700 RepID=UPI0037D42372
MTCANLADILSTEKQILYSDSYWSWGTFMSETGRTWQRAFKGHASEAAEVRAWTAKRTTPEDAVQIAHELFAAVLSSGADVIELTLSTAGQRLRITATGDRRLSLRHSHGPGWTIIAALAQRTGTTTDESGLWAQIETDT